jgi:uncharacterized protein (TIGR00251 family)
MAKFRVRVQPGAKKNQVVAIQDGVVKVKITAPPVEGKANEALLTFLAGQLGVRRREVNLVMGKSSRDKLIEAPGLDEATVWQRLGQSLGPGQKPLPMD